MDDRCDPGATADTGIFETGILKTLTEYGMRVNFNSARTGIRLNGPILSGYGDDMAARQDFIRQTFTTMPMRYVPWI